MRDAEKGTYNDDTTYCPVNAYGACPWCNQCNICHMSEPFDCPDWCAFWSDWDEWQNADIITDEREDFSEEEIEWAKEIYDYEENPDNLELGFNPYMGGYDYDC